MSFILNKVQRNLDFEAKFVKICYNIKGDILFLSLTIKILHVEFCLFLRS